MVKINTSGAITPYRRIINEGLHAYDDQSSSDIPRLFNRMRESAFFDCRSLVEVYDYECGFHQHFFLPYDTLFLTIDTNFCLYIEFDREVREMCVYPIVFMDAPTLLDCYKFTLHDDYTMFSADQKSVLVENIYDATGDDFSDRMHKQLLGVKDRSSPLPTQITTGLKQSDIDRFVDNMLEAGDSGISMDQFNLLLYYSTIGRLVSFLEMKNIVVRDEVDLLTERERRKAGLRSPEVIHKTIIIEHKGKEIPMASLCLNGDPEKRRLHCVRGHVREYSPDKPLFGKYSGKFFIPPHVRGDAGLGAVVKKYKIKDAS